MPLPDETAEAIPATERNGSGNRWQKMAGAIASSIKSTAQMAVTKAKETQLTTLALPNAYLALGKGSSGERVFFPRYPRHPCYPRFLGLPRMPSPNYPTGRRQVPKFEKNRPEPCWLI